MQDDQLGAGLKVGPILRGEGGRQKCRRQKRSRATRIEYNGIVLIRRLLLLPSAFCLSTATRAAQQAAADQRAKANQREQRQHAGRARQVAARRRRGRRRSRSGFAGGVASGADLLTPRLRGRLRPRAEACAGRFRFGVVTRRFDAGAVDARQVRGLFIGLRRQHRLPVRVASASACRAAR